jgi:hypothetical protein
MIKEYLTAMDWDLKTAKPSKKKLLERVRVICPACGQPVEVARIRALRR